MSSKNFDERLAALRHAGRYAEAAALCRDAGDHDKAAELYAAVWDWPQAIEAAKLAGRHDLAYKYALESRDRKEQDRLRTLLASDPEDAERAASHAERKGQLVEAGRLLELAGHVGAAAERFERAEAFFDAARCYEAEGHYREAGMLYERQLKETPWDARTALRLGRILSQYGRFEHAVRALQTAVEDPEQAGGARRLMVACFDALGMDDAAASCLDALRRDDPATAVTVEEFLSESFGDDRGLLADVRREAADEKLLAGRYRVLAPLGAGATGRVVLARDDFYDREVAIKVLTVGAKTAGRDAYARFAREARVAAGLEHPNVVRVFEYHPQGPFLVMEHMSGGTLDDRLTATEAGVPTALTRHVLASVLTGLEAVHRRGVVHRDLKPANVFFDSGGDVKIGDFGVAHLADLGSTLTGAMLGTLAYMAPEQITGAKRPDATTDLYAVGVLLFRMTTGALPYPGPDFVTQHLEHDVPRPSDVDSALAPLDPLVARLLAKEPDERPESAAAVLEELRQLPFQQIEADRHEGPARASSATTSTPAPSAPPNPDHRYAMLEPCEGGGHRARDAVLDRVVRLVPCDEATAARLRALARLDSPNLQAVYDVDPERGRAILEHPSGTPLEEAGCSVEERHAVLEQAQATLAALAEAGFTPDPSRIVVGPGRFVVLLPESCCSPTEGRSFPE
jgi:serine/threonine-protein kinase